MTINKHSLVFDPSESDCDNVGAYLKSSDGTLLTHTTQGLKKALDVHLSNSNIQVTQGTSPWIISEAGFSGCNHESITVTTTATDLLATELVNRKSITIQNLGTKDIFIGCDNTVTDTTGTKIPKGATGEFRMGPNIDVHAITKSGTCDVRILEFS